jgi:carbon-monoxide dehydrogenase small subunit
MKFQFVLNDEKKELDVHPMMSLLDALRSEANSPGTKYGCGEGECGACTVILNDELVMSCMVPVCQAEGGQVETIEGIARSGAEGELLDAVQQAFVETGGAQCGICTPGMIMAGVYYLRHPELSPGGVREALEGNLCRCTGYTAIFRAMERAKELMAES